MSKIPGLWRLILPPLFLGSSSLAQSCLEALNNNQVDACVCYSLEYVVSYVAYIAVSTSYTSNCEALPTISATTSVTPQILESNPAGGNYSGYVTVSHGVYTGTDILTGPTTRAILGLDGSGTLVVEDPPSYTTVSRGGTATVSPGSLPNSVNSTSFLTTNPITAPRTILVANPTPGASTASQGTVVVAVPDPRLYNTSTLAYTGSDPLGATRTTISTIAESGFVPGTYVVAVATTAVPDVSYDVSTVAYTGTAVISGPTVVSVIQPTDGSGRGTVVIGVPPTGVPPPQVTSIVPYEGMSSITGPTTILNRPFDSTVPGTVIVGLPPASFITQTVPFTGREVLTAPITITIAPPSGSQHGTVVIGSPSVTFLASFVPFTGSTQETLSVIQPTGTSPGVVIIGQPGGSNPDVEDPTSAASAPQVTPTRFITSIVTYTPASDAPNTPSTLAVIDGTVIIGLPRIVSPAATGSDSFITSARRGPFVTSTVDFTQGVDLPTTVDPVGTVPGTVFVYASLRGGNSASPFVTSEVVLLGTAAGSAPTTISVVQPTNGLPGTLIIGRPAIFVTSTVSWTGSVPLASRTTLAVVAPSGNSPGTVFVADPAVLGRQFSTSYVRISGTQEEGAATTLTLIPGQGTSQPAIVDGVPDDYITSTIDFSGADILTTRTTLSTLPPNGVAPGFSIVADPSTLVSTVTPEVTNGASVVLQPDFITSTVLYEGSTTSVLTSVQPLETNRGTIVLAVPSVAPPSRPGESQVSKVNDSSVALASFITSTAVSLDSYSVTSRTTISTITPDVEASISGTYVVALPNAYVTSTVPWTGAILLSTLTTISTIPPSDSQPGVVVVAAPNAIDSSTSQPVSSNTAPQPVSTSNAAPGDSATPLPATQLSAQTLFATSTVLLASNLGISSATTLTTLQGDPGSPSIVLIGVPVATETSIAKETLGATSNGSRPPSDLEFGTPSTPAGNLISTATPTNSSPLTTALANSVIGSVVTSDIFYSGTNPLTSPIPLTTLSAGLGSLSTVILLQPSSAAGLISNSAGGSGSRPLEAVSSLTTNSPPSPTTVVLVQSGTTVLLQASFVTSTLDAGSSSSDGSQGLAPISTILPSAGEPGTVLLGRPPAIASSTTSKSSSSELSPENTPSSQLSSSLGSSAVSTIQFQVSDPQDLTRSSQTDSGPISISFQSDIDSIAFSTVASTAAPADSSATNAASSGRLSNQSPFGTVPDSAVTIPVATVFVDYTGTGVPREFLTLRTTSGTVIVQRPRPLTTVETFIPGSISTEFLTIIPSGTEPVTIVFGIPSPAGTTRVLISGPEVVSPDKHNDVGISTRCSKSALFHVNRHIYFDRSSFSELL
ncbi:hypothetical protein CTAM01_16182 [Colletotrichum tamarilloi]|uniref:Cell agglutination protein mam3 n=1 Tax=Colletotrichum tamarilloi TaxID=1209934 RepID=A0ABQ9QJ91_9PEZI|nr:uncharacterized protein CTAM01_16182 [Colletotrichum tamarilloi]KAK1473201.1 hypothetical protein CTAM01_16182 [Colletotrichum tamarilloi]